MPWVRFASTVSSHVLRTVVALLDREGAPVGRAVVREVCSVRGMCGPPPPASLREDGEWTRGARVDRVDRWVKGRGARGVAPRRSWARYLTAPLVMPATIRRWAMTKTATIGRLIITT
ncbi:hypothetical protein GCM10010234_12410 [Streptomyces hawaiiensis]